MNAKDLMTPNPRTCEATDDLLSAIQIMKKEDCGIVPVTKGNGEGKVVGVVTDRDVALCLGEEDRKPSEARVEEAMTKGIVWCEPEAPVEEVSRKMQEAQVRRILVLDSGRLVGVISTADLARASTGRTGDPIGRQVELVIEKVSEK
jgi:CBS domain-containing protein